MGTQLRETSSGDPETGAQVPEVELHHRGTSSSCLSCASLLTVTGADVVELHLVRDFVEVFVDQEGTEVRVIRNMSPIVVTLVSFWHFTVIRGQVLTPSIAFTSVSVYILPTFISSI